MPEPTATGHLDYKCANNRCRLKTFCYRYRSALEPLQGFRIYGPPGLRCPGFIDLAPDQQLKEVTNRDCPCKKKNNGN